MPRQWPTAAGLVLIPAHENHTARPTSARAHTARRTHPCPQPGNIAGNDARTTYPHARRPSNRPRNDEIPPDQIDRTGFRQPLPS